MSIVKTVNSLNQNDKLSTNAFWKLKKSMKKNPQPKIQRVELSTGVITNDPEKIKNEVAKEFQNRLANRKPHPEWEGNVKTKNEIVDALMRKETENSEPFSMDELFSVIKLLKNGKTPGCDGITTELITRGGAGVILPLLEVLNIVKDTKQIPEKWNDVNITLIYKNKGVKRDLANYRGIFLTIIVSKIFEKLLLLRMTPSLNKVTLYQAGSRKNRSVADNLFLLRGCMDFSNYTKLPLYLTTYDFKQAFDSLWLEDCILSLEKTGVELYILQLVHAMNKEAKVTIKTPHGPAGPIVVNDLVKQGGVLGPVVCSASTGEYCDEGSGYPVGAMLVKPLAFVDDTADSNVNKKSAETAHERAVRFGERKKLTYSTDKCMVLIQNEKPTVSPPELKIADEVLKIVNVLKYLGDMFNNKGNNKDLIDDRIKRGIQAKTGIIAFLKENNLGVYEISVSIILYHAVFISSVLFNCQAWSNISNQDIQRLKSMQCKFLKEIVKGRKSMANSFILLELGILPIECEIHLRQLSFLHHVINLSEDDPVKKLFRAMESLPEFPNWLQDIKNLLKKYSIDLSEEQIKLMSKYSFKKVIKNSVYLLAFEQLKQECRSKSKTQGLSYSEFKMQNYLQVLTPPNAKVVLQARSKTLDIKAQSPFLYGDTICRVCNASDENLPHVLECGSDCLGIDAEEALISAHNPEKLNSIATRVQAFLDSIPDS